MIRICRIEIEYARADRRPTYPGYRLEHHLKSRTGRPEIDRSAVASVRRRRKNGPVRPRQPEENDHRPPRRKLLQDRHGVRSAVAPVSVDVGSRTIRARRSPVAEDGANDGIDIGRGNGLIAIHVSHRLGKARNVDRQGQDHAEEPAPESHELPLFRPRHDKPAHYAATTLKGQ